MKKPRAEAEGTCYCIHCGEQYAALPPRAICTTCGHSKVVDLARAEPAEIVAALRAKRAPRWNLPAILLLTGVAALLLIIMAGPNRCARKYPLAVAFRGTDSRSLADYMHAVSTRSPAILDCYRGAAVADRDTESPHRLTMQWRIGADGATMSVYAGISSLPKEVGACATDRIAAWRFEPPVGGKPVGVVWPFLFPHENGEVTIWSPPDYVVNAD